MFVYYRCKVFCNSFFFFEIAVLTFFFFQTFRKIAPLAVAKELGLDINVQEPDAKFAELFPVKKIPAFVSADGFAVHELIAVTVYRKFFPP